MYYSLSAGLSYHALISERAPGGRTELVAKAATAEKETEKEGRTLRSVGLAAGAGAAGFGSVFILRKGKGGGNKDVTPQAWAEKKQEEWKVAIVPTRPPMLSLPACLHPPLLLFPFPSAQSPPAFLRALLIWFATPFFITQRRRVPLVADPPA